MDHTISLPTRVLLIEWRFKPSLALYAAMDRIGIALHDDYPDWTRSPVTLEIRNKKRHRRFFMSHRRSFFESIAPLGGEVNVEIEEAFALFGRLANELAIHELERMGVRQWIAPEKDCDFQHLVSSFSQAFYGSNSKLRDLLGAEVADVSYIAEAKTPAGWEFNLRCGPMQKAQWFSVVNYEQNLFESDSQRKSYQEEFPERVIYIDVDAYKEGIPKSDAKQLAVDMARDSRAVAARISQRIDRSAT